MSASQPDPMDFDTYESPILALLNLDGLPTEDLQIELEGFGYQVLEPIQHTFSGHTSPLGQEADALLILMDSMSDELRFEEVQAIVHSTRCPTLLICAPTDRETMRLLLVQGLWGILPNTAPGSEKVAAIESMLTHATRQNQLTAQLDHYQQIFSLSPVPSTLIQSDGHILLANQAFKERYQRNTVRGIQELLPGEELERLFSYVRMLLCGEQSDCQLTLSLSGKSNISSEVQVWMKLLQQDERILVLQWLPCHSSEKSTETANIKRLDRLTGLPSRTAMLMDLKQRIQSHQDSEQRIALLMFDIEGFNEINEEHGFDLGDQVLKEVATRLKRLELGLCARISNDTFALVLEGLADWPSLDKVRKQVHNELSPPYPVGYDDLTLTFVCVESVFPDHGTDADQLLNKTETLLQRAKKSGFISPDRG